MEHDGLEDALAKLDELDVDEQARIEREREEQKRSEYITRWHERVKWAREHDDIYFKRWASDRKVARGDADEELEVNVNLIAAATEVIAAFLYARNPDQNIRPSDSVDRSRLSDFRMFAKTLEIVVGGLLNRASLKRKAKRWIRATMTTGTGWVKAAMQTRIDKDPVMEAQINDLKQQIDQISAKKAQIEDEPADRDLLEQELKANLTAAEAQLELVVAEGLVLDVMKPEDVTVAPDCGEIENYLEAPWICFDAYKSKDEVMAITGWKSKEELDTLKEANRYMSRPRQGEPNEQNGGNNFVPMSMELASKENESERGFYLVREIWSLRDGVVYTMIDGIRKKWAREPYAPVTGRRFYPGFLLGFHYIDGERYPQSDVHQLKSLQKEYNETRSDFRKHRRRAVPGIIFDETAITPESVVKLQNSTTQEYVGIETINNTPDLRAILHPKLYNQVDIALYDTTMILREFEKMSGAQEALQQSVSVEKTATEAKIQQEGFGARTGSRRDELEDVLTDMVEYVAQLALQLFDQADAERYAGTNAVWMQLTNEQVMYMFDFEIKAGSTGKPQALSDRESWATLMPLMMDLIQKIGAARIQGQEWAARPFIALLVETMERLDDHADIEQFLPVPPPQQPESEEDPEADKTASDIKLNEAKTIDTLAAAIQKVPNVATLPVVRQLFGMGAPEPVNPPPQVIPETEQLASIP